jgi:putative transcriptional regulator
MAMTAPFSRLLAVLVTAFTLLTIGPARAADEDLGKPILLIASQKLAQTPFAETVLLAVPFRDGEHVGFILNKPTDTRLEALFPGHAASRNVKDPVYVGGPVMPQVLFAVVREADQPPQGAIPLMPGLVFVNGEAAVDAVIEKAPNRARFYAGLMGWRPGELQAQLDEALWTVRAADPNVVFRSDPAGVYPEMRRRP